MNSTHRENGTMAGPLIFTVPAYGFVMALYLEQVSVIHAIELIAAQDQVVLKRALQKVVEVLARRLSINVVESKEVTPIALTQELVAA